MKFFNSISSKPLTPASCLLYNNSRGKCLGHSQSRIVPTVPCMAGPPFGQGGGPAPPCIVLPCTDIRTVRSSVLYRGQYCPALRMPRHPLLCQAMPSLRQYVSKCANYPKTSHTLIILINRWKPTHFFRFWLIWL